MTTLKSLVDETTNIKDELVTCYTNLKNNLVDKGVEVLPSDKMLILIDKVNNVSSFLPSNKPISLEVLNLGTMPNDIGWNALADDKLIVFNFSNNPYKNVLDLNTGEVESNIKQGSISGLNNYPSIFGNHTLDSVYCKYTGSYSAVAYQFDLNTLTMRGTGILNGFTDQFAKTYRVGDKIYCFSSTTSNVSVRSYDITTTTNTLLSEVACTDNTSIVYGGVAYDGDDCLYSFGRKDSSSSYIFSLWKYTISTNTIEHLKSWEKNVPTLQSYSRHDLGKVVGRKLYVFPCGTNNAISQVFSIDLDTFEIVENIFGIRRAMPALFSCNDKHTIVANSANTPYQISYVHFKNK